MAHPAGNGPDGLPHLREIPIAPRSAYLHIPFCHRRCFYCDFAVVPLGDHADGSRSRSVTAYLALLHREILRSPDGPPLSTVYIGGGTPSLCSAAQIAALLAALRRRYGLAAGAEVTLEMDPASFDRGRLQALCAAGINRVSLGGQSFDDAILEGLGRRHRRRDLLQAARWLDQAHRRGDLISWSLDLIQGVPGESASGWTRQLRQALALRPPHLSIYDLSIEPGTVFARRLERGELALPDPDLAADLLEETGRRLAAAGYGHYEISNHALPGHASRHNRVYWSGAGWWGFGMGATSAPWGERLARPRTRAAYAAWLDGLRQGPPDGPGEAAGPSFEERVLVGLRRREGVPLAQLAAHCALPREDLEDLTRRWRPWVASGRLLRDGPRWRLSDPEGMALSNGVFRELLLWWEERPSRAAARGPSGAGCPETGSAPRSGRR
jgi:oxygen-independent coproporphyrinogen-3 oxidase